ncbi:MAG: DUF3261 domain-containing protein [Deltaproteobacteria bacterium]|nr:DUF3261 domain-containing protein [Deltaproteobacteria bacterium]
MKALALFAWVTVAACGGPPKRQSVILTGAPSEYPGVLPDPRTLPQDFMVRQTLTIRTKSDGKPVEAELDAVLQKQGDTLLIVGFGPMNAKAFTLTHRGDRVEFAQFMGRELPFSPRNVVLDVHRVYFKRLPTPSEPRYTGVRRGELDGESLEETWQDGQLRGTVFTRPGSKLVGAIRVERGPGCDPTHCEPESATLINEWFGYTLSIVSEDYERL